jgi:signal transduction histidine kinase
MVGLPGEPGAPEVAFLRTLGFGYLALVLVVTLTTEPKPSFDGEGLGVLLALIGFVAGVVVTSPRRELPERRRVAGLLLVAASSTVLAALQPSGLWEASPYFIGVVAAMRLERRTALWVLGVSLLALAAVAAARDQWGAVLSVTVGAVPWFLIIRMVRRFRDQNIELERSRTAEAEAAAEAERAHVAREMHDVLAHSLSALAIQLETTRLIARSHEVDPELGDAIDRARHLAATGLDETRRAMGALRGDELPGPERVPALAEAFEEESGLPVALEIEGEPRPLEPDARLALYRTAQEALTNVRRHAAPDRVDLLLAYRPDATVLVVADHGRERQPAVAGNGHAGYGLTGMRERAELLGGELVAGSTEDGFRVELRLPA